LCENELKSEGKSFSHLVFLENRKYRIFWQKNSEIFIPDGRDLEEFSKCEAFLMLFKYFLMFPVVGKMKKEEEILSSSSS
jgi:hypothetical protein